MKHMKKNFEVGNNFQDSSKSIDNFLKEVIETIPRVKTSKQNNNFLIYCENPVVVSKYLTSSLSKLNDECYKCELILPNISSDYQDGTLVNFFELKEEMSKSNNTYVVVENCENKNINNIDKLLNASNNYFSNENFRFVALFEK